MNVAALHRSQCLGWLGEVYLLDGRIDDAVVLTGRAFDLCRKQKERGHEAWTLRLLGEIASGRDPPEVENSEQRYREARALAEELAMRPLVAHCHLGLAKLYGRVGRRQKAREHLATAAAMYREMDMRSWLEQAEAEASRL